MVIEIVTDDMPFLIDSTILNINNHDGHLNWIVHPVITAQRNEQGEIKQWLRSNTEQAQQAGVFGVPAWVVDGHVFWGLDGLPMLQAYLRGDEWFAQQWEAAAGVSSGLE